MGSFFTKIGHPIGKRYKNTLKFIRYLGNNKITIGYF